MQIPKRRSQTQKAPTERDNHLSAAALKRLKETLEDLERNQRPRTVEELSRAREMGDLSENAAYSDAKGRLAGIDGRIFSLKERIKNAVVIESGPDESGRVRIGSTVIVSVGGREKTYEITGSMETNPSTGRISHLSPLGSALLHHAAGDRVTVKAQDREIEYQIVEVR